MGCCLSTSSDEDNSHVGEHGDSSGHVRDTRSLSDTNESGRAPRTRPRRDRAPLDQHIDKPLRRHQWTATDRSWTRNQLAAERADFFETRVTGRPEIWQAIHTALQILWDPTSQSDEDSIFGLATAQSILSAAEISLPTGNLVNGVYDALGNYYQLPAWVVADPRNVLEDNEDDEADNTAVGRLTIETLGRETVLSGDENDDKYATANEDGASDTTATTKRLEKGKGTVDVSEQIKIRARLSENGLDVEILANKADTVRTIRKKILVESGLQKRRIRIVYMGKILKDSASLEAQGWQTDHLVNAMVSPLR